MSAITVGYVVTGLVSVAILLFAFKQP